MVFTPHLLIAALASLSSLALAVAALVFARPGWIRRGFVAGMAAFSVQALAATMLQAGSDDRGSQALWLTVREAARLVAPLAWLALLGALTRRHTEPLPRTWRLGLTLGGTLAFVLMSGALALGAMIFPSSSGPFDAAILASIGVASAAFQVVVVVGVLAGL